MPHLGPILASSWHPAHVILKPSKMAWLLLHPGPNSVIPLASSWLDPGLILAQSWPHLGPIMASSWHPGCVTLKPSKMTRLLLHLGPIAVLLLGYLGLILAPSWPHLGPMLAPSWHPGCVTLKPLQNDTAPPSSEPYRGPSLGAILA